MKLFTFFSVFAVLSLHFLLHFLFFFQRIPLCCFGTYVVFGLLKGKFNLKEKMSTINERYFCSSNLMHATFSPYLDRLEQLYFQWICCFYWTDYYLALIALQLSHFSASLFEQTFIPFLNQLITRKNIFYGNRIRSLR